MAYDEQFADRVRSVVREEAGYDEKKMFGGLAFMVDGNMAVGVMSDGLMVRLDPDDYESALAKPGTKPFEMGKKQSNNWVTVDESVLDEDGDLYDWIAMGVEFARTLPPK